MEGYFNPTPPFFIGLSNLYLICSHILFSKLGLTKEELDIPIPNDTKRILDGYINAIRRSKNEDIATLRSSICRKDLDKSTRILWEDTLKQFYNRYGYDFQEGLIDADHLAVKLAFVSYLFRESAHKLGNGDIDGFKDKIVVIHRFFNVHLLPMIRECENDIIYSLKPILSFTLGILRTVVLDKEFFI